MKSKLIMALCASIFISSISNAASYRSIYNKLNSYVGLYNIKIIIRQNSSPNAEATCNEIFLNSGSVSLPKEELAFVLAHEMAHIKLGHSRFNYRGICKSYSIWKISENEADRHAIAYMKAAGFDACKGSTGFFRRLLKLSINGGGLMDSHMSTQYRLKRVEQLAC